MIARVIAMLLLVGSVRFCLALLNRDNGLAVKVAVYAILSSALSMAARF